MEKEMKFPGLKRGRVKGCKGGPGSKKKPVLPKEKFDLPASGKNAVYVGSNLATVRQIIFEGGYE